MALARKFYVFVLAAVLAACATTQLEPEDIRPIHYANGAAIEGRVEGLRHAIEASPNEPIRVLTVHGIIVADDGYSLEVQAALARRLGLARQAQPVAIDIERGYEVIVQSGPAPTEGMPITARSRLTRSVWVNAQGVPRLVFYELFWAPLRDEVKYRYLGCFESRSVEDDRRRADEGAIWDCRQSQRADRNTDRRTWINGALKDGLMVRGFADAVIVTGPIGDVLEDDLALATCVVASDIRYASAGPAFAVETFANRRCDDPALMGAPEVSGEVYSLVAPGTFFVITESLGSYFFLNAQVERAMGRRMEGADALQFALLDRATVFMFANQVSLLNLSSLTALCFVEGGEANTPCPNTRLSTLDQWMDAPGPGFGSLATYVAFNDVDDVLGFELPPYLVETGLTGALVNVSVRNPGFELPFLYRSIPGVHTRQDENAAVVNAIVEGIDIPPDRRP